MLRFVLAILALTAVASAQPWGPFEIAATGDSTQQLRTPQMAVIDSQTARIFYTFDVPGQSEIRTALYNLTSHQVIGTPEVARTDSVSQPLLEAAADGELAWVAVYNRRFNAIWVDTKFVIGHGVNRRDSFMGTTGFPNSPYVPDYYLSDFDMTSRAGSGWTLAWIQVISPPPWYENDSQITVAGLSADSMDYHQPLLPPENRLFGPYHVAAVSVSPDSSLVLTERLWGLNWDAPALMLRAVAGADTEALDTVCTFDCDVDILRLNRASDGSLLAYSDPSTLYRIDESRGCETLGSLSVNYAPSDMAFRSAYGYASIWVTPGSILLGRLHEDGTVMQPGIFRLPDTGYTIRDASVDIAPDGRIYVVWTEGSGIQTRVMISRISWDTPLGADDSHLILHPSSFRLSAFPNPFNSELRIEYDLPRAEIVALAVHNLLGQKVATLYDGLKAAGTHTVTWAPQCGTGIYFVRLKTAEAVRTTKVVYLR